MIAHLIRLRNSPFLKGKNPVLTSKQPSILIVDDEKPIRDLLEIYLEGFKVYVASDGRQALEICGRPDLDLDILVTDILMPQINGRELANRICSIKPFIKVLFISAYSAEILSHYNLCPDGADYIKKPFTRAVLLDRINRVWATSPHWKELVSKP